MRLQEIHPAIVHFPIALYPTALGADTLGKLTDNKSMVEAGKWGITLSAGAAALAVATGAIAQESMEIDGEAHDLLVAHRNLNVSVLALLAVMALHRSGRESPGAGYLAAGTVGLGALMYSAYLGGHMVYEHGAAVKAAGKLREERAPLIRLNKMREVASASTANLIDGIRNTFASLASEPFLPNWRSEEEPV